MPESHQPLTDVIQAAIAAAGSISFAKFMELALYHPVHGYYQRSTEQIGCQGDFYTSVSVGPLFGQLLAWQFAEWSADLLRAPERPPPCVQWVEAGAHDGQLACDILGWLQRQRPELYERLQYWVVEPSAARRQQQIQRLQSFDGHVHWSATWADLPEAAVTGIIFSNELLDAFPVYRAGWDRGRRAWFEWRVAWSGSKFEFVRSKEVAPSLQEELERTFWRDLPVDLLDVLPDGFTLDLAPGAARWWAQAAHRLARGHLLALDYGLDEHELLAPGRADGTLRSYRRHCLTQEPLAQPGEQDLTAHVNFSTVRATGEEAGLQTVEYETQSTFLTRIAARVHADLPTFGVWGPQQNRQLQTLVHPQHLGQSFRVLRQIKLAPAGIARGEMGD